jgi:hypothetical protein
MIWVRKNLETGRMQYVESGRVSKREVIDYLLRVAERALELEDEITRLGGDPAKVGAKEAEDQDHA